MCNARFTCTNEKIFRFQVVSQAANSTWRYGNADESPHATRTSRSRYRPLASAMSRTTAMSADRVAKVALRSECGGHRRRHHFDCTGKQSGCAVYGIADIQGAASRLPMTLARNDGASQLINYYRSLAGGNRRDASQPEMRTSSRTYNGFPSVSATRNRSPQEAYRFENTARRRMRLDNSSKV